MRQWRVSFLIGQQPRQLPVLLCAALLSATVHAYTCYVHQGDDLTGAIRNSTLTGCTAFYIEAGDTPYRITEPLTIRDGRSLTFEAYGSVNGTRAQVDLQHSYRFVILRYGAQVSVTDIDFYNGHAESELGTFPHGGTFFVCGTGTLLSLYRVNIANSCSFAGHGGAIYIADGAAVDVYNSSFVNCSTDMFNGGAIAITGSASTLTVQSSSLFFNNTAYGGDGGAIYAFPYVDITIVDTWLIENSAYRHGGATFASNGTQVKHRECTYANNTAQVGNGGATYSAYWGYVEFRGGSHLCGNRALVGLGGGSFAEQVAMVQWVEPSVVTYESNTDQGGLYNNESDTAHVAPWPPFCVGWYRSVERTASGTTSSCPEYGRLAHFRQTRSVPVCYMSPTGSDANPCTSPAQACLTLSRTITALNCLTIFVASGVYSGPSNFGITVNYALSIFGAGQFNTTFVQTQGGGTGIFLNFNLIASQSVIQDFAVTKTRGISIGGGGDILIRVTAGPLFPSPFVSTPMILRNLYLHGISNALYFDRSQVNELRNIVIERVNVDTQSSVDVYDFLADRLRAPVSGSNVLFNNVTIRFCRGYSEIFGDRGVSVNYTFRGIIQHQASLQYASFRRQIDAVGAPDLGPSYVFIENPSSSERSSNYGNINTGHAGGGDFGGYAQISANVNTIFKGVAICNNWSPVTGAGLYGANLVRFQNDTTFKRTVFSDNYAYALPATSDFDPALTTCNSTTCFRQSNTDTDADGISNLCRPTGPLSASTCANSIAVVVDQTGMPFPEPTPSLSTMRLLNRIVANALVDTTAINKTISLAYFVMRQEYTVPFLLWARFNPATDTTRTRDGASYAIEYTPQRLSTTNEWHRPLNDLRLYRGNGSAPDAVIMIMRSNASSVVAATAAANLLRANGNTRIFVIGLSSVKLSDMAAVAGDGVHTPLQNTDYFRLLTTNYSGLYAILQKIVINNTCCLAQRQLCGSCTVSGPSCNDNNVCTINDTCVSNANPQLAGCFGVPKPCPNATDTRSVACNTFLCSNISGACIATPKAPGTSCLTHNCYTGVCATQLGVGVCIITPKNCSDGNNCTIDTCTNATGVCVHTPVNCNDANACTNDFCVPNGTCLHTPISVNIGKNCSTIGAPSQGVCAAGRVVCNITTGMLKCNVTPTAENCSNALDDDCNGVVNNGCPGFCTTVANCTAPLVPACQSVACISFNCTYTNMNTSVLCNDTVPCTGTIGSPDHCSGFGTCVAGADNCVQVRCKTRACNTTSKQCMNTSLPNGSPCYDGNNCTSPDTCQTGTCVSGAPINCVDSNVCTVDSCLAPGGTCINNATAANGFACNADSNACTQNDTCSGGTCTPGPLKNCGVSTTCRIRLCNATNAECYTQFTSAGTFCDDGNACTLGTTCDGLGNCTGGFNVSIDDFNPCTVDSCDPVFGVINNVTTLNGTACNDTNVCTPTSTCILGMCTGIGQINCSDGNNCTVDTCDPITGCAHAPAGAVPCATGASPSSCLLPFGTCVGLTCVAGVKPCNDSNVCTDDTCLLNGTCHFMPNTALCSGPSLCNTYQCAGGSCVATLKVCPDTPTNLSAQCNLFACNNSNGQCFTERIPNGTACNDSIVLTVNDTCRAGVCVGTPVNCTIDAHCNDNKTCTANRCNTTIGQCYFVKNDTQCTLALPAFQQQCRVSFCNGTAPTGCSVLNRPNGLACNDTNPMTVNDACLAGACVGVPKNCTVDANCSDNRLCTANFCNLTSFRCVAVPNNTYCQVTQIVEPQCQQAFCNGSMPTGCSVLNRTNGFVCNDTLRLTVNDQCMNGRCVGTPVNCTLNSDCNDNKACTANLCNTTIGQCYYPRNNTYCQPILSPNAQCQVAVCNGSAPTGCALLNKANGTACSDGVVLTVNDSCRAGACVGTPVNCTLDAHCNDNKACTLNKCNTTKGQCYFVKNNTLCTLALTVFQQQCLVSFCNGTSPTGCSVLPRPNGLVCNDSNPATINDVCASGVCVGTPRNCTTDANCTDNRVCTINTCNLTANRCQSVPNHTYCQLTQIVDVQCQTAFCNSTPPTGCAVFNKTNGFACNDTVRLTVNDQCTNGRCRGTPVNCTLDADCNDNKACTANRCNTTTGQCYFVKNNTLCTLALTVFQQQCQVSFCNGTSPTGCAVLNRPNGLACNDSNPATINDVCASGTCVGTPRNCTTNANCSDNRICTINTCNLTANRCMSVPNHTYCQVTQVFNSQCQLTFCNSTPPSGCGIVNRPNGFACNDGNSSTILDSCQSGVCTGTPVQCLNDTQCNDNRLCTLDRCNTTTNRCYATPLDSICATLFSPDPQCQLAICNGTSPTGCTFLNRTNGFACNDGNMSTANDQCVGGRCRGVAAACVSNAQCNDSKTCTANLCNLTSNTCYFPPNNTFCTAALGAFAAQCRVSFCNGTSPTGCSVFNRTNGVMCDDNNASTVNDTCHGGVCRGTPVQCLTDAQCNENKLCTLDRCNLTTNRCYSTPIDSICVFLLNPDAECQIATCNGSAPTGCNLFNRTVGTPCNDGNASTVNDTCRANHRCVGTTVACSSNAQCNDNKQCTANLCNLTSSMCYFVPNNTVCTLLLNPDPQCQLAICNGSAPSGCRLLNQTVGLACNDGNASTVNDTCRAGGRCRGIPVPCVNNSQCNDLKQCTLDTCVANMCQFAPNNTFCQILLNPDPQCQVAACNGTSPTGCLMTNRSISTVCNDGILLTINDRCSNGRCVGTPVQCINNSQCNDNKACTRDTCVSNVCAFTPNNTFCSALLSADSQCQVARCNGSAPTGCTLANRTNGFACNDGNTTTNSDTCQNGRCVGVFVPPCLGKLVGELCPGGFCYLNVCVPCPLNNSCTGMQLNASCALISSLVCNRLARDLLSIASCLNGAFAPNGTFITPRFTTSTPLVSMFFPGSTAGAALAFTQGLVRQSWTFPNCTELIRFLTAMTNVTGTYRALQASLCPNALFAIDRAATWPGRGAGVGCGAGCGCGYGQWTNEDLSSASDMDYNDNTYQARITTGQDAIGRYTSTLVELIPRTLGTFYSHRVRLHVNGVPDAPTRLSTTSAYFAGTGRVISRRFNPATNVFATATVSTTQAQSHPVYNDTRVEQALQTGVISLSNRIINTCAARTQLLQAGSLITISAASRAANPTPKAPNPYDSSLTLVLKVTTVASAEVTPPRFNATGHATTKLDCLPGTGEFNSLWIDRVNWKWPKESVKLATMCPQFAQCVQCVCGSAPSATCRSVCENFAANCTQTAPLAC